MQNRRTQREETVIVLDFLQHGYVLDNRPSHKKTAIVQAIGTKFFTLLELVPKRGIVLQPKFETTRSIQTGFRVRCYICKKAPSVHCLATHSFLDGATSHVEKTTSVEKGIGFALQRRSLGNFVKILVVPILRYEMTLENVVVLPPVPEGHVVFDQIKDNLAGEDF